MTLTKLIELQAAATPGKWNGRLLMEITEADSDFCDYAHNFDFAALDAKIKRYEDALRFYAVTDNHKPQVKPKIGYCAVWEDEGERARKALDGME